MQGNIDKRQIKTVLLLELALLFIAFLIALVFWKTVCTETMDSCLTTDGDFSVLRFLFLSAIRPFVFTPLIFYEILVGRTYGSFWGTILTVLGSLVSCFILYLIMRFLGRKLVKPWLMANLPATWQFLISQDYKIVFLMRLIPFFPFDMASLIFGLLNFRLRSVIVATLIGVLPEAYLITRIAALSEGVILSTLYSLLLFMVGAFMVVFVFEFFSRKKGTSLWARMGAMYLEIQYEIKQNNEIIRRQEFLDDRIPPILLMYGFFSSRRTLTDLERLLIDRGYKVMSFNQGGLLGVFYTRGMMETAKFIDEKIKKQMERYGSQKMTIIAHSKGGLTAAWWLLKLGGHRYCDRLITMGTPFSGTRLTYIPLSTPFGFFLKDLWQMRPGSDFLRTLSKTELPENLKIYCMYSDNDKVTVAPNGIFRTERPTSRIFPIPMLGIGHFDYLSSPKVVDELEKIIGKEA